MQDKLVLIGIASGSAVVFHIGEYLDRVFDKERPDRWKDIEPAKLAWRCIRNAGGGTLGVLFAPELSQQLGWDFTIGWKAAVAFGYAGDKLFAPLKGMADALLNRGQ